ncbi:MAG: HD domain-containing protein [Candidatus Omnitrophota bacterium]
MLPDKSGNYNIMQKAMRFPENDLEVLKIIQRFAKAKKVKLYLVGGVLRDLLLERQKENLDFDFCLKGSAVSFGKKLARSIKAAFVVLDKEHGACRLVKRIREQLYTFDFTDFRGKDLKSDLLKRDFTINAIAIELEKIFSDKDLIGALIDPCSGSKDLELKLIKLAYSKAFSDDPLRILRAFSFSAQLEFKIDNKALKSAKAEKELLTQVSFERIRDELFKIFSCDNSYVHLASMDKLGILKVLFPQMQKMRGIGKGAYHHLDVWQHTLESVRQLEILIQELKGDLEIQNYLNKVISGTRKRCALLKLGMFLHDIGKPAAMRKEDGKIKFHGHERIGLKMAEEIAKGFKLSNDEIKALRIMVLWHLRPGYLGDFIEPSARAKFRYFRDTAEEALGVLLLSLADQRATLGPLTTRKARLRHEKVCFALMQEYFRKLKEEKKPRLLNGNQLMKKFKLLPSPLIGKLLGAIEEAFGIGSIASKEEAFVLARKLLTKS